MTNLASRLKLLRALDMDLVIKALCVITTAKAELATEELLLKLRNLGSDIAILVTPLVHGAFGHVASKVTALTVVQLVVDLRGVHPACLLRLGLELLNIEPWNSRRGIGSGGGVGIVLSSAETVGVVPIGLSKARLGRSLSRSAPRIRHCEEGEGV